MSVDGEDLSVELTGMPLTPLLGDTVQMHGPSGAVVGVVKERHFSYEAPDVCRMALACKKL
jgi:hypothetical protein